MHKQASNTEFDCLGYRVVGEGAAIVLLHGFPFTNDLWDNLVDDLSRTYKLIIPNLPGSGDSVLPKESLTIELMAKSVKLILEKENIDTAVIAGHSMGGYVALAFYDLFPELVSGIVMVHSTTTADTEEKKAQRRKSIALFEKGGAVPFVKQMIPVLFSSNYEGDDEKNKVLEQALSTKAASLSAFYNAMINRPERRDILLDKPLPMCWIIGDGDNILPKVASLQQSTLTNVNFVYVYEGVGHMAMIEAPKQLSKHIQTFADYCNS